MKYLVIVSALIVLTLAASWTFGRRGLANQDPVNAAERTRTNGRLFAGEGVDTKFSEAARAGDVVIRVGAGDGASLPTDPPATLRSVVLNQICRADAVVVGEVKGLRSSLVESGAWIFTEYQFEIAEVVKNTATVQLSPGHIINVVRPGGEVKVNNHKAQLVLDGYRNLQDGKRYLLALKYISSSDSFLTATAAGGGFELSGNSAKWLTSKRPISAINMPVEDVRMSVQTLIGFECEN